MKVSKIVAHLKGVMPPDCAYVLVENPESPPSEICGIVTIAVQERIELVAANLCERCDIRTCNFRVRRPNLETRQR